MKLKTIGLGLLAATFSAGVATAQMQPVPNPPEKPAATKHAGKMHHAKKHHGKKAEAKEEKTEEMKEHGSTGAVNPPATTPPKK